VPLLHGALRAAELARDPLDPALTAAFDGPDAASAGYSLARIGGDGARARLATWLDGEGPRAWAVLGLLEPPRGVPGEPQQPAGAWATLEDAVWRRYAVTDGAHTGSSDERRGLLFVIARLGGPASVQRLGAELAAPEPLGSDVRAAALTALGILCARGQVLQTGTVEVLAAGLQASELTVRVAAAFAASRCAASSADVLADGPAQVLGERLAADLRSGAADPEFARWSWRTLAALGGVPGELPTHVLARETSASWAEVEAVRAIVAAGRSDELLRRATENLPALLVRPRVHALLELLRGRRAAGPGAGDLADLERAFAAALDAVETTGVDPRVLGHVRCETAALHAVRRGSPDDVRACATRHGLPMALADAWTLDVLVRSEGVMAASARIDRLLAWATDPVPGRAAAALGALADADDPRIAGVLRDALASDDVGVVAAAAGSIATRAVDATRRDPSAAVPLRAAVERLSNASAVEARIAALDAVGALARGAAAAVPLRAEGAAAPRRDDASVVDPSWVLVLAAESSAAVRAAALRAVAHDPALEASFSRAQVPAFPRAFAAARTALEAPRGRGLRVRTSAGTFEISFEGVDDAPMAQANLSYLAAQRFYEGIVVHRVVPGFVVQAGDPRGDGYGGPGWLVPCEWTPRPFERGSVGIALAGKDTGGSQFFVTQTRQPHLDGRFPLVGHVSRGMEVVDGLLPHDRIESVEVLP
jgi:cyclophilin family peptidyl-prolyl cis-trans isomerase